MKYRLPLCALSLIVSHFAFGQLPKPIETPILGARRPALSPDGKTIAFVYRGDIWTVPSAGGRAIRVTHHTEYDTSPVFSPDGEWIAFASLREGNYDIHAIPATSGAVRQLTYHSGSDTPGDWSPDGKRILFAGERDVPDSSLFELDVATLRLKKLFTDVKGISYPAYSADGKKVAYQQAGFPWVRPRYRGSRATQIALLDAATGKRTPLTRELRQHLFPKFLPDGRVICVTTGERTPSSRSLEERPTKFVDNAKKTPNLWVFEANGRGRQLTRFVGGSVRFVTVARASGDIAFEYEDGIYLLPKGASQPVKVRIIAGSDDREQNRKRETLTSGVTELEPSPDGKRVAFAAKGEIWVVPTEKPDNKKPDDDAAIRLTDYPGTDHDFMWAKDGELLYFVSDRGKRLGLYAVDIKTKSVKPLYTGDGDVSNVLPTPDGQRVAFVLSGPQGGLMVTPATGGAVTRILPIPGNQIRTAAVSPDAKWFSVLRAGPQGTTDIWFVPASGGDPRNITQINASIGPMAWSPDGRYFFFGSDRDGDGLYVLPLMPEVARHDDLEMKFEKPKEGETVKVEIDFADITRRIRRHAAQMPTSSLIVSRDGTLFFMSHSDAWSVSFDGKETKRLTTGGGYAALRLLGDGKKLLALKAGAMSLLPASPGGTPTAVTFTADYEADTRAERLAAFTQFWRAYNHGFYDSNFHGRDWAAIGKRYELLLDAVDTSEEFAGVLGMMSGELESSHSEVGPASRERSGPTTPQLGFYLDYSHVGPGVRVLEVPEGAPGSYSKTKLYPGDTVLEINGEKAELGETLYRRLNSLGKKDLELRVQSAAKKPELRTVRYKPMTSGEWDDLHYRNWVARLRAEVDQRSGGKIAYVHIRSMGDGNQELFEREFYAQALGKDAAIIDVRNNGGGRISDTLVGWLAVKPFIRRQSRDGLLNVAPERSWGKPIVVLQNERSASNAEVFPYSMKQAGLATLVGMTTPGYLIRTSDFALVDGTRARMPGTGTYRVDGSPMEDNGVPPDIEVDLLPEDWLAKRDPQLEAAVRHLMKQR